MTEKYERQHVMGRKSPVTKAISIGWLMIMLLLSQPALAFTTDQQEDICATAAVIFCDNFEARALGSGDLGRAIFKNLGWAFDYPGSNNVVNGAGQFFDGSHGFQQTYYAGTGANACCGGALETSLIGLPGLSANTYIRWYTKQSSNFVLPQYGGKHMYFNHAIHGFDNHDFGTTFQMVDDGGVNPYVLPQNQNGATAAWSNNVWLCFEVHITLNSSPTSSDGAVEAWMNEVKYFGYSNLNIDKTNSVVNDIFVDGFMNMLDTDTHPTQYRWFDNIVASTQRIHCLGGGQTTPPAAPTGLNVQ